uniref:Uncharacterized protein n=1 Tax=Arundo donax TaxID=35708 RepID=A0A0A8YN67_ARUDO
MYACWPDAAAGLHDDGWCCHVPRPCTGACMLLTAPHEVMVSILSSLKVVERMIDLPLVIKGQPDRLIGCVRHAGCRKGWGVLSMCRTSPSHMHGRPVAQVEE